MRNIFIEQYTTIFITRKNMRNKFAALLLIAKEPDLGNTMVISAMLAAMILVSGIRWRFIFGLVSGIFATAVTLTYIFLLIQNSLKHIFYKNIN